MTRRILAASLVAVMASAQEEPLREEARTLLQEGNTLFRKEEFAAALSRYRAAYAKVSSPKILLNIGTTLRRLGQDADAADAYETYLQHIGPEVTADKRAKVREALREIDRKMGRIRIEVTVEGATVRLNGKIKGVSPLGGSIRVDPGWHRAEAERDGYEPDTKDIDVAAGEERLLVLRLQEKTAPLPPAEVVEQPPDNPANPAASGSDTIDDPSLSPASSDPLFLDDVGERPGFSHAWQLLLSARQDFVLRSDTLGAFTGLGLAFGIGDYVDLSVWGLRGRTTGGRATVTAYPLPHLRVKPMVVAGMALLDVPTVDEATGKPYGMEPLVHAGGGIVVEITDRFGTIVDVAYERFLVGLKHEDVEDQRVLASLAIFARVLP